MSQMSARSVTHHRGSSSWIEYAGRAGYLTKGVVYAIVGVLAAKAAWGGARASGSDAALAEIGQQPFGQILLWLTGIGLIGYCVWRAMQAVVDPEPHSSRGKEIAARAGYVGSAVAYAFLAWTAISMALGSGGGGGQGKQDAVGWVLSIPGGTWIVGAGGVILLAVAVYQFYQAATDGFMKHYKQSEMNEHQRNLARYGGRMGLAARGVIFVIIGLSVTVAANTLNPNQVKGLGESLQSLAQQPYGPWLLLAVAVGLIAYAVHCILKARFRYFAL